jgi:hypothetical protein
MDHPYQLIVKVRQRPFTAEDASPNSGVPHMAMQNWELLIARAMLHRQMSGSNRNYRIDSRGWLWQTESSF